jgi:hypothetical protein
MADLGNRSTEGPLRTRVAMLLHPRRSSKCQWRPKAQTPAMLAWEALTPATRAARTHSTGRGAPYLSSPRVERRYYGHELHCGHCGHLSRTICQVKVEGATAFLCSFCLEKGRDANHRRGGGDAMRLAVGRQHKPL